MEKTTQTSTFEWFSQACVYSPQYAHCAAEFKIFFEEVHLDASFYSPIPQSLLFHSPGKSRLQFSQMILSHKVRESLEMNGYVD